MEITDEKIDELLIALNNYAVEIDYEYGLPIFGSMIYEMREMVRDILNKP